MSIFSPSSCGFVASVVGVAVRVAVVSPLAAVAGAEVSAAGAVGVAFSVVTAAPAGSVDVDGSLTPSTPLVVAAVGAEVASVSAAAGVVVVLASSTPAVAVAVVGEVEVAAASTSDADAVASAGADSAFPVVASGWSDFFN